MAVRPALRNSDYSYNKYGQYDFGSTMERARTAIADSLERFRLPSFDYLTALVPNKPETWTYEREWDYYESTTVEMPDINNPYRNLAQYRNPAQKTRTIESDTLTYEDHNRLPDVFSSSVLLGHNSVHSPKAPNHTTLNKRLMSSDSICHLKAVPSLSRQSMDKQKFRDFSRQSLEDLSALPRFSMYLQEPDCDTAKSIGSPTGEEGDCSTARLIRSLSSLGDSEERDVVRSITCAQEEEDVTTAKAL